MSYPDPFKLFPERSFQTIGQRMNWPNVASRGGMGFGIGRKGSEGRNGSVNRKRDRNRRVPFTLRVPLPSPNPKHSPGPFLPPALTPAEGRDMTKIGVVRDIKARKGVAANEIARRAYLYVARNQTLPAQVRYQAQLQLNTFGRYTRPTTVKNRCTESGRGRGIMSEFGLCRVRVSISPSLSPVGAHACLAIFSSSSG